MTNVQLKYWTMINFAGYCPRMGRRSDHSRAELEAMIVDEGHRQMEECGFARFSAREVAKRIGYSIGTLYNVFGSYDRLILAINARTLGLWAQHLAGALDGKGADRMERLVRGYFEFAYAHPRSWAAIYDHRLPAGAEMPEWYIEVMDALTGLVDAEVLRALPDADPDTARALGRSLLATVHGHCELAINGSFARLCEADPIDAAVSRVREAIAAQRLR
jgi:AcrR family transcriptional regulator